MYILFLIPLLLQVIVVPCGITVSVDDTKKNEITKYCESVISSLTDAGIRAKGDFRYNYSPGWKFNHWELKVLKDAVYRTIAKTCTSILCFMNIMM